MNLFLKYGIIIIIVLLSVSACSKDDYLIDSGLAKAETPLTVYDYLKNHRYQMFDSLITLIDHYGIKEKINGSGTFFAPNDYNIRRFLQIKTDTLRDVTGVEDTLYTLNDLMNDQAIDSKSVLQYALNNRITLNGATLQGKEFTTLNNEVITVKKIQTDDPTYYQYNDNPVYFLYYCKDGMENEVCQTTDILTQNGGGTVLHVLNNAHIYDLFTELEED